MRELTGHKVNGCNEGLRVEALDEPGSGGACHCYAITPTVGNATGVRLDFQNGPIRPGQPPNGVTHEALLAVLTDRLEGFQSGPFACYENGEALFHLKQAQAVLKARTAGRLARGVEGTHAV